MKQSIEEIKAILKPWVFIELTCTGASPFNKKNGYAGKSFADSFEFLEVTNGYEHFSNISADPETKTHIILYKDVISMKKHPY
jgi:hypothetical protein